MQRPGLGHRFYSSHGSHYHNHHQSNLNLLYAIMGLNVGIWGYGSYLAMQAQQGLPQAYSNFMRNMTINLNDVLQGGRYWQTITSVFMHTGLMHLGFNMLSAYYLGGIVARIPGMAPAGMLAIVIGSGLCGSAGFLMTRFNATKGGRQYDHQRGLGFSGAVMGLGVVAAFVYPNIQMMLYGIIPAPLWALMLGYIAYDGYYVNDAGSRTAHSGHLGGAAFGAFYYLMRMRGRMF
jgi:membrane associated rhomboid family serine protease